MLNPTQVGNVSDFPGTLVIQLTLSNFRTMFGYSVGFGIRNINTLIRKPYEYSDRLGSMAQQMSMDGV